MRDLERENRQLREENEIPKRACASSPTSASSVCLDPRAPLRISGLENVQSPLCISERLLRVARTAGKSLCSKRRKRRIRRFHELFLRSRRLYGSPKIIADP